MAHLINLNTILDERGCLTVIDKVLPFEIKRVYWINGATRKRGGHRHKKTKQALVCLSGRCEVFVNDGYTERSFSMDQPDKCLLIDPEDWHTMDRFSEGCIVLVLASETYDAEDYINEGYEDVRRAE